MGKFRARVKGRNRGKRWAKGQSSSSNPETKTHRNAAKSRFFQENLNAKSELTSEALQKHNVIMGTQVSRMEEDASTEETGSVGTFKTFETFASDWSCCSNTSFNRLLKGFNSKSALQKEMLAVLAAVTEVIKANGGKETSTEYFGALMTTLEATENEDCVAAILSLLSMGIKTVPENVLKLKFADVSKVFMDILAQFAGSSNSVILRQLIGCLSVLLRAQDIGVWNHSSTVVVFDSILTFTINSKPTARKAAQHAVCAILKGSRMMLSDHPPAHHPAAVLAAKFCTEQLVSGGSVGGSTTVLHTLNLLKEILPTFPRNQLKQACETILKVMTLNNVLILSCGMQALHGLFLSRPSATSLTPELNAQMISALFDYQPAPTDIQPTLAWLAVMQEAYINLSGMNVNLWCANLPRFFQVATQLWLTERNEIMSGVTLSMEAVLENNIREICSAENIENYQSVVYKVIQSAEAGLKYQFHCAWPYVLHLLGTMFETMGEACFHLLQPCLKSLGELRDTEQFTFKNELENAVGKAVKAFGPEKVLSAIPLQITGLENNYTFQRSWLLPVLKENIRGAPLKFFIDFFLPLATMCRKKSQNLENSVGRHLYGLLQSQIWSLLPSFCYDVPDLQENFKAIARILGVIITDHKDIRISVMTSLRRLIIHNRDNCNEGNVKELKKFAKNYLPILFNVYTTKPSGSDEKGQKLAAFETIKVYLTIASPELTKELFDKACEKLKSESTDKDTKEGVLDLLRALISYQDVKKIKELYLQIQETVGDFESHIQKRSYRLLEEICSNSSENCQTFVTQNKEALEDLLLNSLSTCAPSTRGPRLRCLIYLIKRMEKVQMDTLQKIIPEAILCCKDINERCRMAAFQLLVLIGETMEKSSGKSRIESLEDYIGLVMAGLGGPPTLVSATLLALSTIAYEFRDSMTEDLQKLLLENVCLLVVSNSREVVASALSYIKSYIASTPIIFLGPSVPVIVKSLLTMTEDCRRHFRVKTRDILSRLLRKYGYETIAALVPEKDDVMHKRLRNLKKINERKKRAKRASEKASDDEEPDEELFRLKGKPKTIEEILEESDSEFEEASQKESQPKKKKHNTYILEDADTIVDFTDASAAKKIVASLPSTSKEVVEKKKKKKEVPFKTASDGRFIITNSDESEDESKPGMIPMEDDSDDDWDDIRSKTSKATKTTKTSSVKGLIGRKRKLTVGSEASEPAFKYKAGGSGIHRPTGPTKAKKKGPVGSTGEEYLAKKGKGDVKKKGLPDPYAYVPLSRNMLNRRKKKKHTGQFKNLIGAARKGALKGRIGKSKLKMRRNK